VVDSVGAGDAFSAGYLIEILRGGGLGTAMETGAWMAGHVVAHQGDYEGIPSRAEYDTWRSGESPIER
jgi:2-dehydro-3-deoxygluconokinase